MDNGNWRPIQGSEPPAMDTVDWRTQLPPDSRQRIVNKIMDTLNKHLPFTGQEGLHELKKMAERFEEKIYSAATSQSDYLRKISLKMLTMETKSQNTGHSNGGDWHEEVYQQIKHMKEQYLPKLSEMYHKIANRLMQHDSLQQLEFEKLQLFKTMLERAITFLQVPKSSIQPGYVVKLVSYERQITNLINTNKPRKAVPQTQDEVYRKDNRDYEQQKLLLQLRVYLLSGGY